jgi:P4 family phage/plasmid primase-like protien
MTDKIDNKKLAKYRERVYDILEKNRYEEGTSKTEPTHQSYGMFYGTFCLDKLQRKEFLSLYTKAISAGVDNLSILERQKEYAPIIVDIDLEIPTENYKKGTRLYTEDLVNDIIGKYVEAINTYLDVPKSPFKICVFEKKAPQEKELTYKDGFHIMFPDICASTKIRHLLRYKVVKMCEDDETFEGYVNNTDKIIDKAVVSSNGWFLYGSRKPNGPIYELTKIVDQDLNLMYDHKSGISYDVETGEETNEHYNHETLIKFFSVQNPNYSKKYATPLNDEYVDSDIDAECEKLGINSTVKAEQIKYDVPASKEDDVRRACKLVGMLNEKRANDYNDWLHVGLALHNIDQSLLPAWIEFSKKCPKKFKDGECEKLWKTMKNPSNGNVLTIRSLAYWAKQDDPKQYEAYNKEEFKNTMRKSLDGNTYYLAKSVYAKYSDRFVCSDLKTNTWWEFRNHRWNKIQEGYTLKILLSEEFANEYNLEIADISIQATKVSGIEKEELQQKLARIYKIIEKLMNNTFKKTLMDECKSLFYDNKFEDKLDSNIQLMGFENGVYDLEKGVFRDGRPDDYITLSTKNDYHKWTEKSAWNNQIFEFFEQVMPNEKVRKYFLNALCTCISGETKEEKLYIMTGSGSNGKSLTMDLMYMALGDYYMSCPITIITRKRGQSNETAPEKVRMKGRRCGVFQETDDGEKLNVGVMKEFTGGDKVLVRDLFKGSSEMIEFKPQMKYFLTCNQLPNVPSNDDGTWRRLRVIEFGSKFTDKPTKPNEFKINTMLKQTIHMWAPTFISYLIHIYMTEYKKKTYLEEPDEVMASTKQYKMENDFYTEYIMERITITTNPKNIIGKETLWEDFKAWYKSGYEVKTLPKKPEFVKFMTKQLGEPGRRGFENVVFNVAPESDEESGNKNEIEV